MEDKWENAALYESYVGRWSRLAAFEFLRWINAKPDLAWLDVGCGTGALSDAILKFKNPRRVTGIDPSESHIRYCREYFKDMEQASFQIAEASNLPVEDNSVDVVASGLVLNFIENIEEAFSEFKRVCRRDGVICAYVWDYSGRMEMMRYFWDAATSLNKNAVEKDEAVRFPLCKADRLEQLFRSEGLSAVKTTHIDIFTVFKNFDDFWQPFLSGQGPAPGYCMSLSEDARQQLKDKIRAMLPVDKDGSIHLIGRAIAIKGVKS